MDVTPYSFPIGDAPRPGAGGALAGGGPGAASRAAKIARLSAGVVPGSVSFAAPAPRGAAMSLHPEPADRNTAATGVALGRIIDVTA